jgi:biotin operon repressor
MALDDKTLKNIFKNQKKGSINSLRSLGIAEERRKIIRMEYEESTKPTENESGYKQGTNEVQSGYKVSTEVGTNQVQTGYKPSVEKPQLGTNQVQSESKTEYKSRYKVSPNQVQTGYKVGTKIVFSELTGIQREIIFYLCQECKKTRSKVTEPLAIEHLTSALKRTQNAIKTSIKRLQKKGCIIRVKFKNGRGGWSQYEIPEDIYHEAIQHETEYKIGTKWVQTGYKQGSEPGTELSTNTLSSSSELIKTTTTELSNEWNFDISPYARFGFSISQIKQLAMLGIISATDVEQSLIEFSYDLDNNILPPIKTNKINFLMGLLRRGHSYVSETFKNEQQEIISEMARRAAVKQKSLMEEKFAAWEASLSEHDRKNILDKLPTHLIAVEKLYGVMNKEIKEWYFNYFIEHI